MNDLFLGVMVAKKRPWDEFVDNQSAGVQRGQSTECELRPQDWQLGAGHSVCSGERQCKLPLSGKKKIIKKVILPFNTYVMVQLICVILAFQVQE